MATYCYISVFISMNSSQLKSEKQRGIQFVMHSIVQQTKKKKTFFTVYSQSSKMLEKMTIQHRLHRTIASLPCEFL